MVALVLHPGHSKCGSTTIQDFIYKNRQVFRARGVFLPDLNFNFPHHEDYNFNLTHTPRDYLAKVQSGDVNINELSEKIDGLIDNAKVIGCRRVIISAENLINGIASKNTKAIHQLFAEKFTDIKIVYYVRRQDELMLAAWQQWGHKEGDSLDAYIEKMIETRFGDFNFIANQLKSYYPNSKLRVYPLVREYLVEQNLLIDFCTRAVILQEGLNFDIGDSNTGISSALCDSLAKISTVYANNHDQEVKSIINDSAIHSKRLISKKYTADISEKNLILLFDKFERLNKTLHQRYFSKLPFDKVLSIPYPLEKGDKLLHLEKKVEKLEDLLAIQMDMLIELLKKTPHNE
ncbi:hypothetical protein [Pseudoalteromonas lipolytica]|jgi:hypothetical protein